MNKFTTVSVWVPDEESKAGQYKNEWDAIAGDKVLYKMWHRVYNLPRCYPLPDGSMGTSNWGRETYAGRVCALMINKFKDRGYKLSENMIDGDSFEFLAHRYMYGKDYGGYFHVEVDGYDQHRNFEYDKLGLKECPLARLMVRIENIEDDSYYAKKPDRLLTYVVEADAINVLKESAKIFNRKYYLELGYNGKFVKYKYPRFVSPDEELVLFGKLKKDSNGLGELKNLVTVHLSEKNSTVFSVPFDKIKDFYEKADRKDIDFFNTDIIPSSKVRMLTTSLESVKPLDLSLRAIRFEEDSEKNLGVRR